jgi:glycosyltransferase involved in cell wall biosynthesis
MKGIDTDLKTRRAPSLLRVLVLTKRQYMNKDLLDDRFGRFREIPLALAKKGHLVRGICLSYARREQGCIPDGPVLWQSINATPCKIPGLLIYILHAIKLARNSDVIWACSDSFYGVIGCALGKMVSTPVVFDIYDNFGNFLVAKVPIAKQLYHWAIREADAITCLSKPFAKFLLKRFGRNQNVHSLEFAVRLDLFKPLDKKECRRSLRLPLDAVIVGTAGLLTKERDVHLLLQAFAQLKHTYRELHLALAGPRDGGLDIPADPRVHDLGVLSYEEVPSFLNCLDVGVVCYPRDDFGKYCFPQKTREFMACRIPLIASRVGALEELFSRHPEWLYEPGDVRSLIRTLETRLLDRRLDDDALPSWNDLADRLEAIMVHLKETVPQQAMP